MAIDDVVGTPAVSPVAQTRKNGRPRVLLYRIHVAADILVAPPLIIAAITGVAYALASNIEKVVYHEELTAIPSLPAQPPEKQAEVAQRVHPEPPVIAVQVPEKPGQTTRAMFSDE